MQLTGWGCGGARKIIRLFEFPLPAADAQTLTNNARCLEPIKIEALRMLDLQTKSAIDSTDPLVLL